MDYSRLAFRIPGLRRPRLRFSLRFLLLAVLFIAFLFSAFNWGQRLGYENGHRAANEELGTVEPYPKVYYVRTLLNVPDDVVLEYDDFDTLIDFITENIAQGTWHSPGCGIHCFKFNRSIVVSQTPDAHEKLEELLNMLRPLPKQRKLR